MSRQRKRKPTIMPAVEPTLTVVIDPGHGGRQPGTTWRDEKTGALLMEKDINLDVAKRIPQYLPEHVSYYMTRDRDTTINLRNRVVHTFGYDLFVSIHCNAVAEKQEEVRGAEVYVHSAKDPWVHDIAYGFVTAVGDALKVGINEPNPVRSNPRLRVLTLADRIRNRYGRSVSILRRCPGDARKGMRDVGVPAFLIELAYMTHCDDRKALVTKARRVAVAKAIAGMIGELAPLPEAAEVPEEENAEVPEEE